MYSGTDLALKPGVRLGVDGLAVIHHASPVDATVLDGLAILEAPDRDPGAAGAWLASRGERYAVFEVAGSRTRVVFVLEKMSPERWLLVFLAGDDVRLLVRALDAIQLGDSNVEIDAVVSSTSSPMFTYLAGGFDPIHLEGSVRLRRPKGLGALELAARRQI